MEQNKRNCQIDAHPFDLIGRGVAKGRDEAGFSDGKNEVGHGVHDESTDEEVEDEIEVHK